MITKSDVELMVSMADSLHWLYFGILAKHPHDETYAYLFPYLQKIQRGLETLAGGEQLLDGNVAAIFARIKELAAKKPVAKAKSSRAKPKSVSKAKAPAKSKRKVALA